MKLRLISLLSLTLSLTPIFGLNQTERRQRFFGLFNVVRFSNTVCNADGDLMGVCYTAQQCKDLQGEAKGSCARGFGTCCVFRYNGADRNRQEVLERKISYIENPSNSIRSLTLDIKANNKDISQIMLVMENFEMMPGNLESPCDYDYVKIIMPDGSENVNIGKLCGDNNGQHLYVHFPNTTEEKTVTIKIMAKKSSQYRIKIHQLDSTLKKDRDLIAPTGCQQYYKENDGTVRLLNTQDIPFPMEITKEELQRTGWTTYHKNLKYTMCFKKPEGHCQIEFSTPSMKISKISKEGQTCNPMNNKKIGCFDDCTIPDTTTGSITGDYLLIPGGMYKEPPSGSGTKVKMHKNDYYCGESLANKEAMVMVEMPGPVTVSFVSDDLPSTLPDTLPKDEVTGLGWKLKYEWKENCSNRGNM